MDAKELENPCAQKESYHACDYKMCIQNVYNLKKVVCFPFSLKKDKNKKHGGRIRQQKSE